VEEFGESKRHICKWIYIKNKKDGKVERLKERAKEKDGREER